MEQQAALERLDLPAGSEADEVLQVYRARSRLLKELILSSTTASEKEGYRSNLRYLIQCRDAALGEGAQTPRPRERTDSAVRLILENLKTSPTGRLDREGALALLALPPGADRVSVEKAYGARQRALIRRFARARTDEEMSAIRRARNKLRRIRTIALGQEPVPMPAPEERAVRPIRTGSP